MNTTSTPPAPRAAVEAVKGNLDSTTERPAMMSTNERTASVATKRQVAAPHGELRRVDTRDGKAPHRRHLATINRIRRPGYTRPGERGDVLDSEVAATRCGKYLRRYNLADDVSLHFTDGSVYAVECPICFEGGQP